MLHKSRVLRFHSVTTEIDIRKIWMLEKGSMLIGNSSLHSGCSYSFHVSCTLALGPCFIVSGSRRELWRQYKVLRCSRSLCACLMCLSFFGVSIWRLAHVSLTVLEKRVFYFKRWKSFLLTRFGNETYHVLCLVILVFHFSLPVQVIWHVTGRKYSERLKLKKKICFILKSWGR